MTPQSRRVIAELARRVAETAVLTMAARLQGAGLEDRFRLIAEFGGEIGRLLQIADDRLNAGDLFEFRALIEGVRTMRAQARRAIGDLARFPATPPDKPTACRCRTDRHHDAPSWFAEQTVDVAI